MVTVDKFLLDDAYGPDNEKDKEAFIRRLNELGEDMGMRTLLSLALFGYNLQCMAVSGMFGLGGTHEEVEALMSLMAAKASERPELPENMIEAVDELVLPYLNCIKDARDGREKTEDGSDDVQEEVGG